jgi:pyruvate/2-oxoglutarate dehydrogenase complex dihydrolipoamide acyltransferase (E2) component
MCVCTHVFDRSHHSVDLSSYQLANKIVPTMSDSSSSDAAAHAASSHAASSHAASSHADAAPKAVATGRAAKRHARRRKINAALSEGTHHFGANHDPTVVEQALSKRRRGSNELGARLPGVEHLSTPWPCCSSAIPEWAEFRTA